MVLQKTHKNHYHQKPATITIFRHFCAEFNLPFCQSPCLIPLLSKQSNFGAFWPIFSLSSHQHHFHHYCFISPPKRVCHNQLIKFSDLQIIGGIDPSLRDCLPCSLTGGLPQILHWSVLQMSSFYTGEFCKANEFSAVFKIHCTPYLQISLI